MAAIWLFLLEPGVGAGRRPGEPASPGRRPTSWAYPSNALVTVALVAVYKNCGLYMLFFLAGLQAIPRELEDAARVEGATEWRVFRHVTWPLLGPVALYVLITAILDALRNVDHIFVLTRGGPANATNVLLYETYLKAFEFWDVGPGLRPDRDDRGGAPRPRRPGDAAPGEGDPLRGVSAGSSGRAWSSACPSWGPSSSWSWPR